MSIHEQARAEAEKRRYLFTTPDEDENLREEFVAGAIWAATRTRVVTTVTERDALPMGSIVLSHNGNAVQKGQGGMWWTTGWSSPVDVTFPARVLYEPEETR